MQQKNPGKEPENTGKLLRENRPFHRVVKCRRKNIKSNWELSQTALKAKFRGPKKKKAELIQKALNANQQN